MDWLSNLDLTESDINFTTKEYCPQYPHKESIGGNGDLLTGNENKTRFSKNEQTEHYYNGLPTYFFNGGDHNPYYGDAGFISKELTRYPAALAKLIAVNYSQTYKQQLDANDNPITRQNQARQQANQYLMRQRNDRARIVS
jgi:hypothetical protein